MLRPSLVAMAILFIGSGAHLASGQTPKFELVRLERTFHHRIDAGLNAKRDEFREEFKVESGILKTYAVHEMSAFNHLANIDAGRDSLVVHRNVRRDAAFGGGGSYQARVSAYFIRPVIVLDEVNLKLIGAAYRGNDGGQSAAALKVHFGQLAKLHTDLGEGPMPGYSQHSVDSKANYWVDGPSLAPNTKYLIVPSGMDRWTINNAQDKGNKPENFYGGKNFDCKGLGIMRMGGLAVLRYKFVPGKPHEAEIITFQPGKDYAEVPAMPNGGALFFVIGDVTGARGDNEGSCSVEVFKTQ